MKGNGINSYIENTILIFLIIIEWKKMYSYGEAEGSLDA